ncbi:type I restriction-modification system subunit M [uncultured Megasphaera sp.]|uniref:type I restriction-modification system subunit M n=1 Tax=uncultured Megasphaera sp. TaxID=165188 RepID=UPI0026599A2D|nr:type I restriction-modification system subunit M [uncultured Megasphaera sp.]
MNKQQLAAKIWSAANRMRSKIEANEYKDYILGFIFYKYLSEKEVQYLKKEGNTDEMIKEYVTEEHPDIVKYLQNNLGYCITYENLFSTWIASRNDFSIDNVKTALSAFSRLISPSHKKVFEKIFLTLETGLSKLGDKASTQTKAASDLIHLINEIPMGAKQDYDTLGFIYEYLISNFASNAGKKAGEFYTPHEVSALIADIVAQHLKDREEITIYDPTSGSGSLLITIGQAVSRYMKAAEGKEFSQRVKYYAQELKENTFNLTRMNLVMHDIPASNIIARNGDTLEEDWPYFDDDDPAGTYDPLYVDAVVSNPPYSQAWNPDGKESDPRYARFGLAPKSTADYAFLLHDLFHIRPDGIMCIVLPHGVLFRGGSEGEIRRNLIEENHIDAIIGLPANIFYGTGIPTIIMVLKQKRDNTDVLIIDASKGFEKEGKNNRLRASDIRRIADTVGARKTIAKYSRTVPIEEIRANDYNLNIPRYVDSSEAAESYDIYASMYGGVPAREIDALQPWWDALPGLRDTLFQPKEGPYCTAADGDLPALIAAHPAVQAFKASAKAAFADFPKFLDKELIVHPERVDTAKEEGQISQDIFRRLQSIPLVDVYEAYQLFHDDWVHIETDLEAIQSLSGKNPLDAARMVDPVFTVKKSGSQETEIQTGWEGRILPFAMVQDKKLRVAKEAMSAIEQRMEDIASIYEELLENLTEEEKKDITNEAGDAFDWKALGKEAKALRKEWKQKQPPEGSKEAVILQADELQKEEKRLKKEKKVAEEALVEQTKAAIESLTDDEVREFLREKWIQTLCQSIDALPEKTLQTLADRVEDLAKKYAVTLPELDREIEQTEQELARMIDDLTGDVFDLKGLAAFKKLLTGDNHE